MGCGDVQFITDHPVIAVRADLDRAAVGTIIRSGNFQVGIAWGCDKLDRAVLALHVGLRVNADRLTGRADGTANVQTNGRAVDVRAAIRVG